MASDPDNGRTKTQDWYRATSAGSEFSAATALKAIIRSTAENGIADLLKRVAYVESMDIYLYRVTTIIAYGSYLTTDDHLHDVDLSVTLASKISDPVLRHEMEEKQILQDENKNRVVSVAERLSWPKTKVMWYLKNKSRVLAFREQGNVCGGEPSITIYDVRAV